MLYLGVDHHKRYSHLTAVDERGKVRLSCRLPNEREALARVLEDLAEPCSSVVEAGRSWGVMYDLLEELGAEPVLANPYQVRAIAQAKVKTDSIDSHMLAQLLRADLIPRAHVSLSGARGAGLTSRRHPESRDPGVRKGPSLDGAREGLCRSVRSVPSFPAVDHRRHGAAQGRVPPPPIVVLSEVIAQLTKMIQTSDDWNATEPLLLQS